MFDAHHRAALESGHPQSSAREEDVHGRHPDGLGRARVRAIDNSDVDIFIVYADERLFDARIKAAEDVGYFDTECDRLRGRIYRRQGRERGLYP
jgi:hypothetical protein